MKFEIGPTTLRLYAITADGAAHDPRSKMRVRQWLQAGVRAIQLREKTLPATEIAPFGQYLRAITAEYGALFIVNDDPHLAALLDADGCHLGWDDMKIAEARKILGHDKIIGLSTHSSSQVVLASKMDVDYVGVGPIYQSNTKEAGRPLLGPAFAGWAAEALRVPAVAIGGINLANVGQLAAAGCRNVAVVSALSQTAQPAEIARAFLDILKAADSATLL